MTQYIDIPEDMLRTVPEEPTEIEEQFPPGCVVLAHGVTGTSYQRYFKDGLFHAPSMPAVSLHDLIERQRGRHLVLLYRPPENGQAQPITLLSKKGRKS